MTLGNSTMGLHHWLAHVLGGTWHLPHGQVHAALLPHVIFQNAPLVAGGLSSLAHALGSDDPAAGLWDLGRLLGAPADLRSLGFLPEGVAEAVAQTLEEPPVTPMLPTEASVRAVLLAALAGARPAVRASREQSR
jgi:maleylacetate reductase